MKSKIWTAVLSLVIAFGLWAYVITVDSPETESTFYNVPVEFEGETILRERGLMLTSDTDMTVTVKLSGKRRDLNSLKSSDIAAVVDLSQVTQAGERIMSYTVSVPGNNLEVISRNPEAITLQVTEWATKEIPLELVYNGRVPEGYYVDKQNATVEHSSVTVTGPKAIINKIEEAQISVDLNGRTETIIEKLRYSLCDADGEPIEDVSTVTTDLGEVLVSVSILPIKDVKLTYTVIPGGGLTEADITVTLDYDTITVVGSPAALAGLDELSLGSFDLGTFTESAQIRVPIKLPEGVTNQTGILEVTVDITIPERETREFTVTNFRSENLPERLTAQIHQKMLTVTLRGLGPVLDRIRPEDITVVVDFTDVEPGVASFAARIEIAGLEEGEDVGAVDTYSVIAGITEA